MLASSALAQTGSRARPEEGIPQAAGSAPEPRAKPEVRVQLAPTAFWKLALSGRKEEKAGATYYVSREPPRRGWAATHWGRGRCGGGAEAELRG